MTQTTKNKNTASKGAKAKYASKNRHRKRRKSDPTPVIIFLAVLLLILLLLTKVLFTNNTTTSTNISNSINNAISSSENAEEFTSASGAVTGTNVESEDTTETSETLPLSELSDEYFSSTANGYKSYVSGALTSSLGIDVSSHQGWIDWEAVANSDVDFAIIRAGYRGYTDGQLNEDDYFSYNIQSAVENDLDVGVYFFSQAVTEDEAIEEAQYVLELLDDYTLQYPVYFDWESIDNTSARTDSISSSELTAIALAFCQTIEAAGYEAGIYFNLAQASRLYQLFTLQIYDFWLAEYQDTPSFPYAIDLWQYTNEGSVSGISCTVDINLSFSAN